MEFRPLLLVVLTALTLSAQVMSPPRLSYATYTASKAGGVNGLAADREGYAYIAGAYSGCAFLTKLNQTGSAAVWSMCLPVEVVRAVALDDHGYIYLAGSNPNQPSLLSKIMKLSQDGQQVLYSTNIGGADATNLVLDRAGNIYVSGWADATFKATSQAYLTTDVLTHAESFAVKLDPSGSIQYATYLDFLRPVSPLANNRIAVDSSGDLWAVGTACPLAGARVANCSIGFYGSNGAIRKLDANGQKLLVSKIIGFGSSAEGVFLYNSAGGVAVDVDDSVWVVGSTERNSVPITPGALEPTHPGGFGEGNGGTGVAYAVKLSASGDVLYGTYLGDSVITGSDLINSVVLDSQGRPHFALNLNQARNSTIMILSADGSSLLASTDLNSPVQNIALDGNGGLYLSGTTSRLAFLTTPGSYYDLYPGFAQGTFFGAPSSGYAAKFDLTTAGPAGQFSIMMNAASRIPGYNPSFPEGAVAPGEIVTLVGKNLPSQPSVTFDGRPAPILYADANQINAVVPFEVSPPSTVVSLEDVRSYVLPVQPAVPALFTADQSGRGPLAALNSDGTANSSASPAKAGSVISVFLTGAGAMTPPIGNGQLGPLEPPYPVPALGASATIQGAGAPVVFLGQAPGLIAGLVRVDVQIPAGTAGGNATLLVYVGNYPTQLGGTTISVQ